MNSGSIEQQDPDDLGYQDFDDLLDHFKGTNSLNLNCSPETEHSGHNISTVPISDYSRAASFYEAENDEHSRKHELEMSWEKLVLS